jgi:ribonuclease P protein component
MQFTYKKQEKLKSKKLIKLLFEEGKKISVFPIMLLYLQVKHDSNYLVQAGVTVSKKNFKSAVDRNRIKRLLRETYRLNKPFLYEKLENKYIFMFIYLGKKELKYQLLDEKMKAVLDQFQNIIAKK